MKKLSALFLTICLLFISSVPLAAAEGNEEVSPITNDRVISFLKTNNINYEFLNGDIKLVETSTESIAEVNELLASESKSTLNAIAAISYPTPYIHMRNHDIYDSQKFKAARKAALAAAVVEWAKNKFLPDPWKISIAAAGGFGIYYFVNTDVEDLYFYIKYSYREKGPGFFDSNGTFIGDYEILKEIRTTKNSNYTGGWVEHDARLSTIVDPWF
ncbi:hypothetical protein DFP94_103436 [Fontibacillus phaseoli]|uniref:Uncharacterized protein n=1 Tax=Fontibacillus phaseoli TaxID=1416533 RepID=A0A369BGN3_9BACL|nr:hypothetical protein [Fontibacillus phaseoli]RCX20703.1 hypothetical protein DFP94_103436 [Fontibacillus phaseoli]